MGRHPDSIAAKPRQSNAFIACHLPSYQQVSQLPIERYCDHGSAPGPDSNRHGSFRRRGILRQVEPIKGNNRQQCTALVFKGLRS